MVAPVQDCIWCKRPVRRSNIEHILPESLGCPSDHVLRDGVCMACNNGLGHIDQALLRQFEIVAFMRGIPRKGGRPPVINSWSGIRGRISDQGPEFHINAGPGTIETFGGSLHAASPRNGIHSVKMEPLIVGERSDISFKQEFGRDPKLRRAIYKVGFGTLALRLGVAEALRDVYDPVRAFVRKGAGDFDVLMLADQADGHHFFGYPALLPGCTLPIIELAVFGVWFAVDFDPQQRGLVQMGAALTERQVPNWMILPRAA